ncbi:MAG: DUF1674 domain-containing protein [Gammaproteobacteria bacterium]|nr:DUF1674 domain-containing protein [Gammaproteobacteria bacterium]
MSEPEPIKKKPGAPEAEKPAASDSDRALADLAQKQDQKQAQLRELGGPTGPEPTRFGDWERKGRCIDF